MDFVTTTGGGILPPMVMGDELPKILRDGESVNAYFDKFKVDDDAAAAGVQLTHVSVFDAEGNAYAAPYPPD